MKDNRRQEGVAKTQHSHREVSEEHIVESEMPLSGLPRPVEYERDDIVTLGFLERMLNRVLLLVGFVGIFTIASTSVGGVETLSLVMTCLIAPTIGLGGLLIKGVLGSRKSKRLARRKVY